MTDIVDELRSHFSRSGIIKSATSDLVKNAAAEIERLQDEVVSLGITLVGVEEVNALLRAENATLLAAAQGALLPALIEIRNWCMVEGCSEQVDVADKAMIAAGVKDIPCFQCSGDGQWDEGPLPARSSAQISPEYRTVICEECTGSGRLHFSLTSAHRKESSNG
jgi:hypothetical protein